MTVTLNVGKMKVNLFSVFSFVYSYVSEDQGWFYVCCVSAADGGDSTYIGPISCKVGLDKLC